MAKKKESVEQTVRNIRRKTRKQYSSEEKIRIVLEGLRGEISMFEDWQFHQGTVVNERTCLQAAATAVANSRGSQVLHPGIH